MNGLDWSSTARVEQALLLISNTIGLVCAFREQEGQPSHLLLSQPLHQRHHLPCCPVRGPVAGYQDRCKRSSNGLQQHVDGAASHSSCHMIAR